MRRQFPIRLDGRDALVAAYAVAWIAARAFVRPLGGWATVAVDATYFLMPLLALSAQLRAARTAADPETRRAWYFLALASLSILVGFLGWTIWVPVMGREMDPLLSRASDVMYVPFALIGFLSFPADPAFRWRDVRARLDGLLFLVGGAVLSWHFAIEPRGATDMVGGTTGAVLEWVLAIAASFALLRARDRTTRAVVGLALTAQLAFILTDYFATRFPESELASTLLDALFFAAWILRWLSARRAEGARVESARDAGSYRGSLAPALFVTAAYALLLLALMVDGQRHVLDVAVAAVAMTGLLLVRQYLSLSENVALLRATARQTALFRTIVTSSTDLILLVRHDLRLVYASPSVERLCGDRIGASFVELLHLDDRAGVLAWLADPASSLGERGYRCRFRTASGDWHDIELRAQDRTSDSAVRGIVLNGRDVTHELKLEDRLGHARKLAMLSEMAGRIAHAFNNTLAALQGHAEMLARDLPADLPAREDARAIRSAAERGAGITRQLLGFTGRHVIQPTVLRPGTVTDALRPTLVRLLGPTRPLVVIAPDPELRVRFDRAQLEQVLVNLVANARDAMPDGGTVTIRIEARPGSDVAVPLVRIAVSDEGVGIPAEHLPHVLKPFFTTKQPGQGTGLGLAMVEAIARRAGGRVEVTSGPGIGTTVALFVPAAAVEPPAPRVSAPLRLETVDRALVSRHVLLVDDDPLVRTASARILSRAGYAVHVAEDGAEALAIAGDASVPIDLLLTDLMMPGLSGREVIERFRPIRPGVPVVCMTGYAKEREGSRALALASVEIVAKPFTSATLLRAIAEALEAGAGERIPEEPPTSDGQGARSPGR